MPLSGGAGFSVSSTFWPLCMPRPTARVRDFKVRCRSMAEIVADHPRRSEAGLDVRMLNTPPATPGTADCWRLLESHRRANVRGAAERRAGAQHGRGRAALARDMARTRWTRNRAASLWRLASRQFESPLVLILVFGARGVAGAARMGRRGDHPRHRRSAARRWASRRSTGRRAPWPNCAAAGADVQGAPRRRAATVLPRRSCRATSSSFRPATWCPPTAGARGARLPRHRGEPHRRVVPGREAAGCRCPPTRRWPSAPTRCSSAPRCAAAPRRCSSCGPAATPRSARIAARLGARAGNRVRPRRAAVRLPAGAGDGA